ncbi:MAG: restriction endonuclease [Chlorobia bacterium]|nr:restriction endonuclease [Fimbriimonadaceae bacterium]
MSLTDINAPLEEVRSYLTARYDQRFEVHPKLFEEVVASVFRDLGYRARATAYTGDDGIDVVMALDDSSDETTGVQVKRYRDAISVEQLRSLAGALLIGGHTKGVFITTSTFQSGAERTAQISKDRGYEIQLLDAPGFSKAFTSPRSTPIARASCSSLGGPSS